MSINAEIAQVMHYERIADLRREADHERMLRSARLARPRRHKAPQPWWRRLARQLGTDRPARLA